jgi:acyl phosphate:glycerol-3-phosphate acyltransferase
MSGADIWVAVTAYVLGSLPFAWVAARCVSGVDLRRVGSGNVGATNVLRTSPRWAALLVLLLDTVKGSGAVWMAALAGGGNDVRALAGVVAVVGHVYPVWLRFQGGKGVATAFGAFVVLAPHATLAALVAFALLVWRSRYVSLGSLAASVILVPAAWWTTGDRAVLVAALAIGTLVVFRHRGNMRRLMAGTERRLGRRA